MRNQKLLFLLLLFSMFFILQVQVFALGGLFCRPRWSEQDYQKMWIKSVDTNVDIHGQIAVTHLDQIFVNEMNTSVEAIYIFPLPEKAMITSMAYWVNGQKFVADIRERQDAVNAYNQRLRQWLDPALLEYLGDNMFRLSIVPINANTEVRTEITYVEPLDYDLGIVSYKFLLNTLDLSPKPLQTVALQLDAHTQAPFSSFSSPTHQNSTATSIEKKSATHYSLFFGDENFYPDKDLIVEFETERRNVDIQIITYTPAPEDSFGTDSFYTLWITPPDTVEQYEIIPKDIVFTVDVSSSMEGQRMEQVKEALNYFVELLNPEDRFNIITFGTFVEKFKPDLVTAIPDNLEEAKLFIFQLFALGMTNIDDALTGSLQQSFSSVNSCNLIFLTDGDATWGETNPDSILNHVQILNTHDVRIFPFGVGDDINRALLGNLAAGNHGYVKFISADDSIAIIVNNHYQRISKPVLRDIEMDFGGLLTWDQYPKNINDLFWGSQLMYVGLYNNSGTFPFTLKGEMRAEPFEYMENITYADTIGGHRFVPRLWAKAKIDHLMNLIAIYGENDELVDQVIELSLRFQILTPYTAFYADPEDDIPIAIKDDKEIKPQRFNLAQNYPNPFNPITQIQYQLPTGIAEYQVVIKVYDTLGRLIKVLVNKKQGPGEHLVSWDGTDMHGNTVPSGVYFYRMQAFDISGKGKTFYQSHKMILLR